MSQAGTLSVARSGRTSRPAIRALAGPLVGLTFLWWTLIVFEPDRFLAAMIGGPWFRIPGLLAPVLSIMVLHATGGRRVVYWPMACFTLLHLLAFFYAENRWFPITCATSLLYLILTAMLAIAFAKPERLVTLLRIYLLGFIWYGIQGIPDGRVSWHHELNNEDAYGPLLCIGFGYSYYFALASRSRLWRLIGYLSAGIACVGVVASFARGAVLSLCGTLLILWLRSPRKMRTLFGGVLAAGVTLIAIDVLYPGGAFWREMETISEESKESGRWVMWTMALQLWTHHPILGIGAANFGVVAANTFSDDLSRGSFGYASWLWGVQLHNIFVQILCEEGLVGMLLFLGITVGFFRRNWRLRSDAALREWRRRGGVLDLRFVALALELGMVGFLLNGVFYNQLYIHWYWTLLALSLALERCTERQPVAADAATHRRRKAPHPSDSPLVSSPAAPTSLGSALLRPGRANDPQSGV